TYALSLNYFVPVRLQRSCARLFPYTPLFRSVERAAELVPLIRGQVESPLMGEFENLSMWIAAIVMMLSFARVLRENDGGSKDLRSEEHTSELQSRVDLVCRLLLEQKKANKTR